MASRRRRGVRARIILFMLYRENREFIFKTERFISGLGSQRAGLQAAPVDVQSRLFYTTNTLTLKTLLISLRQ